MPTDDKVTHLLHIMALYATADERTKKMCDFILSLDKETIEEVKRIAYAENECQSSSN